MSDRNSSVWAAPSGRTPQPAAHPEHRLENLGLKLPPVRTPVGAYVMALTVDRLVFVAGHAAVANGAYVTGTLGADLDVEQGREAARQSALNCLASLKAEIGDLDRVRQVVKVLGMVRATPDFTRHPAVIDGFSDLLLQCFGDRGRHTRSAVGMASLPFGTAVEVEMIVAL